MYKLRFNCFGIYGKFPVAWTLLFVILVKMVQSYTNLLSPVILVSGYGGNQIDAKLNKPSVVNPHCAKKSDYFTLWLNLTQLEPSAIDCWVDNIRLVYDNVTRTTSNSIGVTTRVPGWGTTDNLKYLDSIKSPYGSYYNYVVDALVKAGYERNVSLRGAPYDFRKAPNENTKYFEDLKALIEETYDINYNRRITLIVHSLGGPMALYFLNLQTQEWKDTYVVRLISLSGVWAGTVDLLQIYASGYNLGTSTVKPGVVRPILNSHPSLAWLMPYPNPNIWPSDKVLVETPAQNYTINNIEGYFEFLNFPIGWEMRKDILPYTDPSPPGVEVHCLFGTGVKTLEKLKFTGISTENPTLIMGNGDGTVNDRSLRACQAWIGHEKQFDKPVTIIDFDNIDHMGIIRNSTVIEKILNILL